MVFEKMRSNNELQWASAEAGQSSFGVEVCGQTLFGPIGAGYQRLQMWWNYQTKGVEK